MWPFTPTAEQKVAAASRWIDEDRKRRIEAQNTPHSIAARKGWARKRGEV